LDREEHHKLLPLWEGPYELVGERTPLAEYIIKVDGEEKPCRVERMKIYKERPAYLCPSISLKEFPMREEVEARDPKDKNYVQEPENFPTGGQENSAEAIMEEKENAEKSNKQPQESRRASKRLVEMKKAEYVIGDRVGIFFHRPGVKDGRNWYCGTVMRVDSVNNKTFIKFLEEESEDHGWYPIGKEMRKCYGHTCGSEAILALTEIALVEGKRVIGRKVKKGVPSKKEVKGTMTTTRAPQGHCWIQSERKEKLFKVEHVIMDLEMSQVEKKEIKNAKKRDRKRRARSLLESDRA
jgi:hypothetical protein